MSDIIVRLLENTGKYPGFENMKTEAAAEITRLRAALAEAEAERDRLKTAMIKIDFMPLPVDEADSHSVILNIKYIARAALAKEPT